MASSGSADRYSVSSGDTGGTAMGGGQQVASEQVAGQRPIRILLVDDHAVMRAGTRRFLEDERDFLIVGEAADGDEALALADTIEADVVLLDINLPRVDGVK